MSDAAQIPPQPRPGLDAIKPYTPGKSEAGPGPVYKLSSNESALGPAPSAIDALNTIGSSAHLYPDGNATKLREKLSDLHDIKIEQIVVGNGSDEILSLMVRAYSLPGDEALMTRHGFSYYPLAAKAEGCVPVMADETDLRADVDALLACVTDKTRLLFLANPNNPTGTRLPADQLERLRAELPSDVMMVLDGAYAEYIDQPDYDGGLQMVRDSEEAGTNNVVMTRTFSKIYGLGGLRVGWCYAPSAVADILQRVRGPFNVSAPALAAAEAALDDQDFVAANRRHNDEEKARLVQSLRGAGLTVRNTEANFLLLEMAGPEAALSLLTFCEEQHIFIRGLTSSNLPNYLRVSIGSREANDAFLKAATDWATADHQG
ncbi:MAG: histidinol-phosphate transaminase [Pseudomonadota bacterium]